MDEPSKECSNIDLSCPTCGEKKIWRDGVRYTIFGNSIQRWLCRNCGYRFSDPNDSQNSLLDFEKIARNREMTLKTEADIIRSRQICVEETKNLDSITELKTVVEDREKSLQSVKRVGHRYQKKPVDPEVRALSEVFQSWLQKEGYSKSNAYSKSLLTLSRLGANLKDPETVKEVIAKHNIRDGGKLNLVYAYDALCKMLKITWTRPVYKQDEIIPSIPEEKELDQLIAACRSRCMATYLQTLKETWTDPSEALRITREDIHGNIININYPVKGHLPRQLEVSQKLIVMLNALPGESGRIFPMSYATMFSNFYRLRNRVANLTQNPRIKQISPNSFRHWGGTMLAYYSNGNVLLVKKMLGHKHIQNTMKYIGLLHFESNEIETTVSTNIEEDRAAMANKFTYVTERNGVKLWQRPKRFAGLNSISKNEYSKRESQLVNTF